MSSIAIFKPWKQTLIKRTYRGFFNETIDTENGDCFTRAWNEDKSIVLTTSSYSYEERMSLEKMEDLIDSVLKANKNQKSC